MMTRRLAFILVALLWNTSCHSASNHTTSDPANSSVKSRAKDAQGKSFPAEFTYVSVSDVKLGADPKVISVDVQLKSALEVFCENRCSKFQLAEETIGSDLVFVVSKQPIVGNTSPSLLDLKKTISVDISKTFRMVFKNSGRSENQVTVDLSSLKEGESFVAAFGEFKKSMAIGGESSGYTITIGGKSLDAVFGDKDLAAQVAASLKGKMAGFVTGVISRKESLERGTYPVATIKTFDSSITED
jgi:hypothetical protein